MKYSASLLLISFLGISLFGLMIFDHAMGHQNAGCIASAIDGTECPTSIIAFAEHHVAAWQSFTTSLIPSVSDWLLYFAFFLFVSVWVFFLCKDLLYPNSRILRRVLQDQYFFAQATRQKIISWLALFENSPAM